MSGLVLWGCQNNYGRHSNKPRPRQTGLVSTVCACACQNNYGQQPSRWQTGLFAHARKTWGIVYSPDSFSAICTAHSRLPTAKSRVDTSSPARQARGAGGGGADHVRAIFAQSALLVLGSTKVYWCWSFSSKDVIETSLTTIIFLRTSVEPELIYLLSPSHLSSFTDGQRNFFAYHPPHGEARRLT